MPKTTFNKLELTALIAIGGDGSLSTALQLHEEGIPIIGVPKTIDNDLEATAMTFGFDSAVACVADALDRLHTTATATNASWSSKSWGGMPDGSLSTADLPAERT